uniref:Endonuclease/exonuclease/phosphatase domain-containing protein n=1 Tax=Latimeria chalumnae TaxID=7897 RepID=H2ZXS3_LATCH
HPTSKEYSFYSKVHNMFSRIDLMLISTSLLPRVESCSYLLCSISDHSPLNLTMDFPEVRPPDRQWWLSPRLLIREGSMAMSWNRIDQSLEVNIPAFSALDIIWEALKATLRGHVISYSVAHRKKAQVQLLELELDLRWAKTEYYKSHSVESRERVAKIRHELNMLSTSKAEYTLLRTKSRYYARGDKVGKLLAWQMQKEESECRIQEINTSDSATSREPGVINETFASYYSTLYTSETGSQGGGDHKSQFLDGIVIPALKEEDKLLLEWPITEEEVISAIEGLPTAIEP